MRRNHYIAKSKSSMLPLSLTISPSLINDRPRLGEDGSGSRTNSHNLDIISEPNVFVGYTMMKKSVSFNTIAIALHSQRRRHCSCQHHHSPLPCLTPSSPWPSPSLLPSPLLARQPRCHRHHPLSFRCHSWRLPLHCRCCPAIHCTTTIDGHRDCAAAVAVFHCDTCRHPSPPQSPIADTIARFDCADIPPSIAHSPLLPIAIALLSCNLASPFDVPPPLNMLAGCHIGMVVLASPPRQWVCGVPPLHGRGYRRYGLVCRHSSLPWHRCPMSGDKDGTDDEDRGDDE
jgi:hypothetical protein